MFGIPRPAAVRPLPLSELADLLSVPTPDGDTTVTGVSLASGRVQPGDLYAALPGSRRHGAEFLPEAVERGAVAVLTDVAGAAAARNGLPALVVDNPRSVVGSVSSRVYGDPTRKLSVIGITGTNGKTSTSYLVESGLRAAGRRTGLIGTVEIRVADEVIVSERTTPEAPDLQALFAYAVEAGVTDFVMEVSSHALELHRADGIHFAVGGFTMFGRDHLDFHPSVEDYFAAKARLFDGRCDVEVINADDDWARRLLTPESVTYSLRPDADTTWRATDIDPDGFDQTFQVHGPDTRLTGAVRLPGEHNVANALLAYGCLTAVGVAPDVAVAGVGRCPGVPGRMELVSGDNAIRGVVDYAHKPDAVDAVLAALRPITAGRIIAVIGAGGDRDASKRAVMGRAAAAGADLVIVTDDNPRSENPAAIRDQVLSGVGDAEHLNVAGRTEAIREAVSRAVPGDTVAVLGKGHEQGQELADRTVPFDDRLVLADVLAAHHH